MKKSASRPPLFEVRHSPVHGYGVFALRRIRKGTTVTEYLGERVSHEEADARYENKDPDDNHTFLFTVDSKTVIDGGVGGNDARYINHGCDPNCESSTLNKRIYVEAIRTIEPGEELAYDYQIERDPEDPPNVDEIFACRCGAVKCRGSMLVARRKPRKKSAAKGGAAGKTGGRLAPKQGAAQGALAKGVAGKGGKAGKGVTVGKGDKAGKDGKAAKGGKAGKTVGRSGAKTSAAQKSAARKGLTRSGVIRRGTGAKKAGKSSRSTRRTAAHSGPGATRSGAAR